MSEQQKMLAGAIAAKVASARALQGAHARLCRCLADLTQLHRELADQGVPPGLEKMLKSDQEAAKWIVEVIEKAGLMGEARGFTAGQQSLTRLFEAVSDSLGPVILRLQGQVQGGDRLDDMLISIACGDGTQISTKEGCDELYDLAEKAGRLREAREAYQAYVRAFDQDSDVYGDT